MIELTTIRAVLVEDDAETRQEIARILSLDKRINLVRVFQDAESAVEHAQSSNPDVVLMDIKLKSLSGIDCVRLLKPHLPGTEFMMLTVFDDYELIFNSIQAGATGYLLKQCIPKNRIRLGNRIYS